MSSPYLIPVIDNIGSDYLDTGYGNKLIPIGNMWLLMSIKSDDPWVHQVVLNDGVPEADSGTMVATTSVSAGYGFAYDPVKKRFVVVFSDGSDIFYYVGKIDGNSIVVGPQQSFPDITSAAGKLAVDYNPSTGCFLVAYSRVWSGSTRRAFLVSLSINEASLTGSVSSALTLGDHYNNSSPPLLSYDPLTGRHLLVCQNTGSIPVSGPQGYAAQLQTVLASPGSIPVIGTKTLLDTTSVPATDWWVTNQHLVYDPASKCHLFGCEAYESGGSTYRGSICVLKVSGTSVTYGDMDIGTPFTLASSQLYWDFEYVPITRRIHVSYNPNGSKTHQYNTGIIDAGSMTFSLLYSFQVAYINETGGDDIVISSYDSGAETLVAWNTREALGDCTLVPYAEFQDYFWTRKVEQVEILSESSE